MDVHMPRTCTCLAHLPSFAHAHASHPSDPSLARAHASCMCEATKGAGGGKRHALEHFLVVEILRHGSPEDALRLGDDRLAERSLSVLLQALLKHSRGAGLEDRGVREEGIVGSIAVRDEAGPLLDRDLAGRAERVHFHRRKAEGDTREDGEHLYAVRVVAIGLPQAEKASGKIDLPC